MVSDIQRKALLLLSPSPSFGLVCIWLKKTSWLKEKNSKKPLITASTCAPVDTHDSSYLGFFWKPQPGHCESPQIAAHVRARVYFSQRFWCGSSERIIWLQPFFNLAWLEHSFGFASAYLQVSVDVWGQGLLQPEVLVLERLFVPVGSLRQGLRPQHLKKALGSRQSLCIVWESLKLFSDINNLICFLCLDSSGVCFHCLESSRKQPFVMSQSVADVSLSS